MKLGAYRRPPKAAKGSLAWRSLSDATGHGGIFGQIDNEVEKWRESLE
jgi:hypothetical protein